MFAFERYSACTVLLKLGILSPQLKNLETPKIDTVREDLPCWLVTY